MRAHRIRSRLPALHRSTRRAVAGRTVAALIFTGPAGYAGREPFSQSPRSREPGCLFFCVCVVLAPSAAGCLHSAYRQMVFRLARIFHVIKKSQGRSRLWGVPGKPGVSWGRNRAFHDTGPVGRSHQRYNVTLQSRNTATPCCQPRTSSTSENGGQAAKGQREMDCLGRPRPLLKMSLLL